jgi:hypothetical protein
VGEVFRVSKRWVIRTRSRRAVVTLRSPFSILGAVEVSSEVLITLLLNDTDFLKPHSPHEQDGWL